MEVKTMNVVTTKVKGWQKRCWEFAMEGKGFEVTGVEWKHIHFFQELCGAYNAKYKFSPGKFTLRFPHAAHETHSPHAHAAHALVQHGHSAPAQTSSGHHSRGHSNARHHAHAA